ADLDALARVWGDVPQGAERIVVPAGETLARAIVLPVALSGVSIVDIDVTIEAGARFELHLLCADADYGRMSINVTLHEGAHFEMGGAILGNADQTLEIVTQVNHNHPNATSNQVVRKVLAGHATGSFLGKVAVARHAQGTDAAQSVKAMLLDRTATANAKPELEIYADDVKCAHGATVGELDKGALFYMAARGIPPQLARKLMLQAFIADAFVSLGDDATREAIEARALAALEALA
ncbi:SufD family Fe-S cluster assembly protein, partial [Blastomonas sp.]|uniref:SufD family Fe-S cluster assembly protein n=1 Tax=Blastomonas sp. TaxID=1909299 RepID=UPI0035939127